MTLHFPGSLLHTRDIKARQVNTYKISQSVASFNIWKVLPVLIALVAQAVANQATRQET